MAHRPVRRRQWAMIAAGAATVAVVSAVGLGSALAGLLGHQRAGVTQP